MTHSNAHSQLDTRDPQPPEVCQPQLNKMPIAGSAIYNPALAQSRTEQERTLLEAICLEHNARERSPTVSELRGALCTTALGMLSASRLQQIVRNINKRLADPANHITLTEDRPIFKFRGEVQAAFLELLGVYNQAPTRRELTNLLRSKNVKITKPSLDNILRDLRQSSSEGSQRAFRLSRCRLPVTWRDISKAYNEAAVLLKSQGVRRAPASEDVSHFLKRAGLRLSARALEYRMLNCPEKVGIKLAAYSDPAPDIIRRCYKKLKVAIERAPTIKELTKAFNDSSLRNTSTDAVWARIQRMNGRAKGTRVILTETKPSGIYDSDIKANCERFEKQHARLPTFTELREGLLKDLPLAWIGEDSLHRRVSRLGITLTHENYLKSATQLVVSETISDLRIRFGRGPMQQEVLEELIERGTPLSSKEFFKTLGTLKKRRSEEFRQTVLLARPYQLLGNLSSHYEALTKQTRRSPTTYPTTEALQSTLGWTREGLTRALPVAQERSIVRQRFPIVLADTTLGESLQGLRELSLAVLYRVYGKEKGEISSTSLASLKALPGLLKGWQLPPLPSDLNENRSAIDEALLSCELSWIHLVCMYAPDRELPEQLEFEARKQEAVWDRIFSIVNIDQTPFKGMAQALLLAQHTNRMQGVTVALLLESASTAPNTATAWKGLRIEVQALAQRCGFPSLNLLRPRASLE